MKNKQNPPVATRPPRQRRALYKVELILEAAIRLLDQGGLAKLTTNAVAAVAGVSIGTLYQYFANKEAILDALAEREVTELSKRVMAVMQDRVMRDPETRIASIVRAVAESYGGRRAVHRLVMTHSLGRGSRKLAPTVATLIGLMTSDARPNTRSPAASMSQADAFVAANAFIGVTRAMIDRDSGDMPSQEEIEKALTRMLIGFVGARHSQATAFQRGT